jgi:hypothetical protein
MESELDEALNQVSDYEPVLVLVQELASVLVLDQAWEMEGTDRDRDRVLVAEWEQESAQCHLEQELDLE